MSQAIGSALPPACSIAAAAEWIVPGSFGCGSTVFAAIATLAPSRAARTAIASPMPREPPVMNSVLPRDDGHRMVIAAELRRPLLEERGDALDEIGACPRTRAKLAASASSCSDSVRAERFAHQPLRVAQRERAGRSASDCDDGVRRGVELGRGHDPVDEPSESASAAPKRSPSRKISIALRRPTRRGSDHEPPPSGVSAICR